jgi:gliding motility-associated-like protein
MYFFDFCKVRLSFLKIIVSIILIFNWQLVKSQGPSNIWYFGNQAGLSFSTNPPTALTNSAMSAFEGCATISDDNGNLLFYTNGSLVWNRNHAPMPAGNGLFGNGAATQTAIIVPGPQSTTKYYIFTVDTNGGPRGLCYSEVDMSLNGGLGDVTVKNIQLITPVTEKLTAVRHGNGIDAWVVVHGWNNANFYSFEITSAGINITPVTSNVGVIHGTNFTQAHGYLKASNNAQKIACAIRGLNLAELFDFNNANGQISNPVQLPLPTQVYGLEFSPDNSLLYVGATSNPAVITQYNVNAGSTAAIQASATPICNYAGLIGGLQLGPDNKIYVCQFQSQNLAVINQPNIAGVGCGFSSNAVFLGGRLAQYGLPNFLQSFVLVADFTYSDTCSGSATQFTLTLPVPSPDSVRWNFDDPTSGALNTSILLNPSHIYQTAGSYDVNVIVYDGLLTDTVTYTINIATTPDPDLGNPISICGDDSVQLNPGSFPGASFLWNDNSTNPTYWVTQTEVIYVNVTTLAGCVGGDTLDVSQTPAPIVNLGPTSTNCVGDTVVLDVTNTPSSTYLWQDGTTSSTYTVVSTGNYVVTVSDNGCSATDNVLITFNPAPAIGLGNDTTICAGFSIYLDATNQNATYVWQDGSTNAGIFVSDPGIYVVQVFVGNCFAADTITIDQQAIPEVFLGEDSSLCAGQPIELVAYAYVASYNWQDGSNDSIFLPKITGKYYVSIINQCGVDADTVEITFNECNCKVYIPTAFSPNNDPHNNIFNFTYNCTEFSSTMDIYNRIGQLIFSSNDPTIGWDGTYNGKKAAEGVYLYVIKYRGFEDGRYVDEVRRKTFTLVR